MLRYFEGFRSVQTSINTNLLCVIHYKLTFSFFVSYKRGMSSGCVLSMDHIG